MCDQEWSFFSHDELKCQGTGECNMNYNFMNMLVNLRRIYNKPIVLTSAFRSEEHNNNIGGSKGSAHVQGKAVDIAIDRGEAYKLLKLALEIGFAGIGISQKGQGRFLHLDTLDDKTLRPTIWSY